MGKVPFLPPAVGLAIFAAVVGPARAQQGDLPDLSGSYRCEPEPSSCDWSGQSFTVTQSGPTLEIKNDKGVVGEAKMSSPITMSVGAPWNMIGEILGDHRTIQWSNGTDWRKQ